MRELSTRLESDGYLVWLPEAEVSENDYQSLSENEKRVLKNKFINLHLDKVRKSEAVLIANFPKHGIAGYVGPNTLMEIAFAYALGKKIILLFPLDDQSCRDEIYGLAPEILKSVEQDKG